MTLSRDTAQDALAAGRPLPAGWDDVTCALKGTGRVPLSAADRSAVGELAARLPLFG